MRQQEARPQGPSLHPATWASSCLRVTAEGPPPTSHGLSGWACVFHGQHPSPQTHGHTGLLVELYWARGSAEECQPEAEFPLELLKLGSQRPWPSQPQESTGGRESFLGLVPIRQAGGGGREMRSGLNTRRQRAWVRCLDPNCRQQGALAREGLRPGRVQGTQGEPAAGRAGSGGPHRGVRSPVLGLASAQEASAGAMGMPPPGTKAQTSWCPADGKVPRRTYSGGPRIREEGSLAQEAGPGCAHSRWGVGMRNPAP